MKFGFRKPSIKKSFKSRTTGRAKRSIFSLFSPSYGKRGAGFIKNPKKATYNKIYNKTSTSIFGISPSKTKNNTNFSNKYDDSYSYKVSHEELYQWDPDFYPNKEENNSLNMYYNSLNKMREFRKTNPNEFQVEMYLRNSKKNLQGLRGTLKYWERTNNPIPPNVPLRSESIDIFMRANRIKDATSLYEELKKLGLFDNYIEQEEKIQNMINNYPDFIRYTINFIKENPGVEQSKARKKLSKNIESNALTWILNRTFFITKKKENGKNHLYLNEHYL